MRAVIQRVTRASVTVDGEQVSSIEQGLLVLLGVGDGDTTSDMEYMERKLATLRIFEDNDGKMNLSVEDVGGAILLVSQFTLYGDCRKGRRPSFVKAMHPDRAEPMVDAMAARLRQRGIEVGTGVFGAMMDVELLNDGPVTLLIDSAKDF